MGHGSIQLEKVRFEVGKSFRLFSPRLRNTFFWHYHPEFELVFVEADAGIRHVVFEEDPPLTTQLAIIAAELRLRKEEIAPAERHRACLLMPDNVISRRCVKCGPKNANTDSRGVRQ